MRERFQSQQRIGAEDSPSIRYRPRRWALCPEDKSKRAQKVVAHLPEPLNARQKKLYDEPGSIYQSGSSRRDPPPRPRPDRPWAHGANPLRASWRDPRGASCRPRVALGARPLRHRDPEESWSPPRPLAAERRAGAQPVLNSRTTPARGV